MLRRLDVFIRDGAGYLFLNDFIMLSFTCPETKGSYLHYNPQREWTLWDILEPTCYAFGGFMNGCCGLLSAL